MAQGVNIKVQDNGLGQSAPGAGNTLVVIGCTSSGAANVPTESVDPSTWISSYGYGPGVEAAAFISGNTGNPVTLIKAATSVAGASTAVTPGSSNTSASVMTLSGAPLDTYYGLVTVVVGGTIGTAGIRLTVSLDAGRTTYLTKLPGTSTSFAVPNTGLTLSFTSATLVAGDTFAWVSTEPQWNTTGIAAAITGLLATTDTFLDVVIVGGGSASTVGGVGISSADFTAIDTDATTMFNRRRFTRILTNARDVLWGGSSTESEATWITAIEADFASSASDRVSVSAGAYNCISPISQTQFRRPLSWLAAQRDSGVAIQVDLGRVKDGALPAVLPTSPDGFVYHDEAQTPGLDGARFLTVWTLYGFPGVYIKNPNIMCSPGSDFNWLQHGHVIDVASQVAYQFFTRELSDTVRVSATTGHILEQDAQDLELRCTSQLTDALTSQGAVSAAVCVVSRTDNILSTSQLTVSINVTPLGYLKAINVTIRFVNPAVQQVA